MTNLFVEGRFQAHSGDWLDEKIECDALTAADWKCLASMIGRRINYMEVIGVPRGGLVLANALLEQRPLTTGSLGQRVTLVVDDVLTTGNPLREVMAEYPGSIGFVIFDRSGGKNLPPNCRALFTLDAP